MKTLTRIYHHDSVRYSSRAGELIHRRGVQKSLGEGEMPNMEAMAYRSACRGNKKRIDGLKLCHSVRQFQLISLLYFELSLDFSRSSFSACPCEVKTQGCWFSIPFCGYLRGRPNKKPWFLHVNLTDCSQKVCHMYTKRYFSPWTMNHSKNVWR